MSEMPRATLASPGEADQNQNIDPDQGAFEAMTSRLEAFHSQDPELVDAVQALRTRAHDPESPYQYSSGNGSEHLLLVKPAKQGRPYSFYDIEVGSNHDGSESPIAGSLGREEIWVTAAEHHKDEGGHEQIRKATFALSKRGRAKSRTGSITGDFRPDGSIANDETTDASRARELVLDTVYKAEPHEGMVSITAALAKLRQADPELIGAIKQAREAGMVTTSHFSESIAGSEAAHDGPEGASLTLTDISRYPDAMKHSEGHYGNGILLISAHDWVTNEKGERTVVSGVISMDEKGKLIPTTELAYPTDTADAPAPGTRDNVVITHRPYRGRTMVFEDRRGEGNPQRIRAMAIDTAHKIVEGSQAEEVAHGPETVAA